MLPALRHPNCAERGKSSRDCETACEQQKVESYVGELLALDKNLGVEYQLNVAAKRAAERKKLEEQRAKHRSPETWQEHWMAFKELLTPRNSLFVLAMMLLVSIILWLIFKQSGAIINSDCGGYISATTSGSISTPAYPSDYDNNLLCIWLIVAPVNYYVKLTINDLSMEGTKQNGCLDYLEIRDGSSVSRLLYYDCNVTTSPTVKSTSQWMWVRVKTNDDNVYAGFQATWQSEAGGLTNVTEPIMECQWTHFQCANKECVSWSWVCDKWNDCGCYSGCDEDGCGGLNYEFTTIIAIGLGSGGTVFIIVVVVIVTWDNYQKKKAKRQEEERQKEAIARKRKQDNMKAVILTTEAITAKKPVIKVTNSDDKSVP